MTTAIFNLAASIPKRVGELNTLVAKAGEIEESDEVLYNAICRATSVLLASHLEGFIKDLTEALVADLNEKLTRFERMPEALQRAFCRKILYFEGANGNEVNGRIEQLITFFRKHSVPIENKAFTYKENDNKNSTTAFIDSLFAKLGVPDVITSIANSRFEVVFDNDDQTNSKLLKDLARLRPFLAKFPHRRIPKQYRPTPRQKTDKNTSLWHLYIEEILTRRHKVAHGNTLDNETSWKDLRLDVVKMEVLIQGLMYSAASYLYIEENEIE